MAETTAISWADKTFNPWYGCTEVSPGCDNCYARTLMDERMHKVKWGAGNARVRTTPAYWNRARQWAREARETGIRPRVFPSLCDPLDAEVDPLWKIDFEVLRDETDDALDWLLLTKRPNLLGKTLAHESDWWGTSIESAAQLWRLDALRQGAQRAAVRFLSLEPLIGPLNLPTLDGIDWVIVGGESGPHRRPMELEWALDIALACWQADVPFWFKQISHLKPGQGEAALGQIYHELPEAAA